MTDQVQPDQVNLAELTIDLRTITLGEMAEAELAAGRDFTQLLRAGKATRALLALFLREYRSSGTPPSWSDLSSRRPLASSSSTSPSASAGHPATPPG